MLPVLPPHPYSWLFFNESDAKEAFPDDIIVKSLIIDPSKDQTFKRLMSIDNENRKYLISFINSL